MKKRILLLLICISNIAIGQEVDCDKFKNGNFKIVDDEVGNSIIVRKGSKQIEYGVKSKLKVKFEVNWINDCTYTLEAKKILENPNNIKLPEGMILTVEIVETKEKSYIQKSSSNLFDMVFESEVIQVD